MFMLSSLSLIVVHRQTAASSSSKPPRIGQQTFSSGFPNPTCTNPPSTSTQSPNFSASIGQVGIEVGGGLRPGTPPPPPPPDGGGLVYGG